MLECLTENELIPHNKAILKPRDPCITQPLLLTIFIYLSLTALKHELSFLMHQKKVMKFDKRVQSVN